MGYLATTKAKQSKAPKAGTPISARYWLYALDLLGEGDRVGWTSKRTEARAWLARSPWGSWIFDRTTREKEVRS